MRQVRTGLVALTALAPALAAAQEPAGFEYGWAAALGSLVVVAALFFLVFKRRPPPEGRGGPTVPPR